MAQLASASGLGPEGPVFESQYPDKKRDVFQRLFFCRGTGGAEHPILLCLGALPLLYPAAPPSVFAFGKYTAPAVALVREYVVGFLGGYGLGSFLDYRLREAVLVINVFGFCDYGSACGFSIHLQSGFRPLLYMPFFLMRDKGKRCWDLIVSKRPGTYRLKAAIILAGDRRANNSRFIKSIAGATCSKNL